MKIAKKVLPLTLAFAFAFPGLAHAEVPASNDESDDAFLESLDPDAAFLARISGLFSAEDPSSIYDFSINDREVEFILDGSWEINLVSAVTIGFGTGTAVYGFTPPVFTQAVDLTSWVFLDNTWYFESSFAEEFTKNTVAAGYLGNDETAVKHVRIGNSGIMFPDGYPFVRVGGGTAIAPGVMGTFAGEKWNADAIVRYDASSVESLVLAGMNEVTDTLVSVTAPLRGKWFVLPDAPVTGAVAVYVEDSDGAIRDTASDGSVSGRRWRKLDPSEFTVSGIQGVIELDAAVTGAVAVRYGGAYAASSTTPGPSLAPFVGDTINWFTLEAAKSGKAMPAGYLPDPASAEELSARFLVTLDGGTALIVRERGYFSPFEALMRYQAEGSDYELVYAESGVRPDGLSVTSYGTEYAEVYRGNSGYGADIRTPECRFPLAREFPYLYLPAWGGMKPDTDLSVRSRTYSPVSSISLGDNVVAGTIQVTRNGIPDSAFRFDESSGILELENAPLSSETLRITWYRTDESARNGTLTAAGGFRWRPVLPLELSLASVLNWNTAKDGYTDSSEPSPGSYVISAGASWKKDSLSASTSFAFEIQVPDTTGFYRILGMDTKARTFYPSGAWYSIIADTLSPVLSVPDVATAITLGRSLFVVPEGTNGDEPPSVTDTGVSGSVLVLKASLPSSGHWTGAEIASGTEGDADLSVARTVAIALKNSGTSANFDVYLQLGLTAGGGSENPSRVRTWKLATPDADSRWVIRSIRLDDADRSAIASGNDIRIIAVPSAGNPVAVNLRSGPLEIAEAGFGIEDSAVEITEGPDPLEGMAGSLSSVASSVIDRFNAGGANTVMEISLSPASDAEELRISKSIPAVPALSYRYLSFYLYSPNALTGAALIRVALDTPAGVGTDTSCVFELSPASLDAASWHKVTLDFENREIDVDGSVLSPVKARVVSLDRTVSPTRVHVAFDGWPVPEPGSDLKVYFDEFYLEESSPVRTARNETSVEWKKSGTVLSAGRVPVLSDPSLSFRTVTSNVTGSGDVNASGTVKAGGTLHKSRIDGSVGVSNAPERTLEIEAHSVSIPLGPVTGAERYSSDFSSGTLSREDRVSVSGPVALGASIAADQNGRTLERTAGLTVTPAIPETPAGTFSVSAASVFSQEGKSPFPEIGEESWAELWTESFESMTSTGETDATKRNGSATLLLAWGNEDLVFSGINLEAKAESAYKAGSDTTIGSAVSYGLSFPLAFASFSLTPGWNRSATQDKPVDAGGSWISDTETLAGSFRDQPWLVTIPPVYDLFDDSVPETIKDEGTWSRSFTNRYSLQWLRPSPGILADLWTPASIDASVQRETETDASSANARDIWSASVKAGFSALNIAGSSGVLRLFPWYEQDEISQLYGWTPKWGSGYFLWSLDTWHSVTLFFADSGTVSGENAFHYDAPDIAGKNELTRDTVRVVWKRPGETSPVLAPLRGLTDMALSTRREDSMSCTVSIKKDTVDQAFAYDHVLTTGIGKNGELSLTGGAGFVSSEKGLQSVELRVGVGGKLSY